MQYFCLITLGISVKLAVNNYHVSGRNAVGLPGLRSKVKVVWELCGRNIFFVTKEMLVKLATNVHHALGRIEKGF